MIAPNDEQLIPASAGVPRRVIVTVLACIALCFVIGGLVLSNAAFGHVWPAQDTLTLKL
jgi:hypothetical protein